MKYIEIGNVSPYFNVASSSFISEEKRSKDHLYSFSSATKPFKSTKPPYFLYTIIHALMVCGIYCPFSITGNNLFVGRRSLCNVHGSMDHGENGKLRAGKKERKKSQPVPKSAMPSIKEEKLFSGTKISILLCTGLSCQVTVSTTSVLCLVWSSV